MLTCRPLLLAKWVTQQYKSMVNAQALTCEIRLCFSRFVCYSKHENLLKSIQQKEDDEFHLVWTLTERCWYHGQDRRFSIKSPSRLDILTGPLNRSCPFSDWTTPYVLCFSPYSTDIQILHTKKIWSLVVICVVFRSGTTMWLVIGKHLSHGTLRKRSQTHLHDCYSYVLCVPAFCIYIHIMYIAL